MTQLVFDIDQGRSTAINMNTTLETLYGSWNDERQSTIRTCFVTAGFIPPADEVQPEDPTEQLDEATWQVPNISFEDFVFVDDNLVVASKLTDQEIVDRVVLPGDDSSSDSDDDESKDDTEKPPANSTDIADMVRKLRNYSEKLPAAKTADVGKVLWFMATVKNLFVSKLCEEAPAQIHVFLQINGIMDPANIISRVANYYRHVPIYFLSDS